jgi:CheY-like chemotaxis protein
MAIVLVVDDEPDLLLLARLNLERDGHHVVTASDGMAALDAVHEAAPDVVVLDVMMPAVDGWTVLERIKSSADSRVKETPIVMLTAISAPEARARGGIEGAVRWLTKPFGVEDLLVAVRAALDEPEPLQRKRAQQRALESIARIERGDDWEVGTPGPRPRLTGLEHTPQPAVDAAPVAGPMPGDFEARLNMLTETQREVIETVRNAATVQLAAARLGVSRSSLYATLRRAARRLGVRSVPDLLAQLRTTDRPTAGP